MAYGENLVHYPRARAVSVLKSLLDVVHPPPCGWRSRQTLWKRNQSGAMCFLLKQRHIVALPQNELCDVEDGCPAADTEHLARGSWAGKRSRLCHGAIHYSHYKSINCPETIILRQKSIYNLPFIVIFGVSWGISFPD